jgi:hypothetical protein
VLCDRHSVTASHSDSTVLLMCLERKNDRCLHTLKVERRERRDTVNTSKREAKLIYCLGVPAMLKSSPMLGSVYSCVKEPLRKSPSKYKSIK